MTTKGGTATPVPFFENAGRALISGAELEITALLSARWTLNFSYAYTDADLKEYLSNVFFNGNQQVLIDRADEPMPRVPRNKASFNLQYNFETDIGGFWASASATYTSEIARHFDRGSFLAGNYISPERVVSNLRVGYRSPSERFLVNAWVDNISDDRDYLLGGVPLVESTGLGSLNYAPPRTYGVKLSYRYH